MRCRGLVLARLVGLVALVLLVHRTALDLHRRHHCEHRRRQVGRQAVVLRLGRQGFSFALITPWWLDLVELLVDVVGVPLVEVLVRVLALARLHRLRRRALLLDRHLLLIRVGVVVHDGHLAHAASRCGRRPSGGGRENRDLRRVPDVGLVLWRRRRRLGLLLLCWHSWRDLLNVGRTTHWRQHGCRHAGRLLEIVIASPNVGEEGVEAESVHGGDGAQAWRRWCCRLR